MSYSESKQSFNVEFSGIMKGEDGFSPIVNIVQTETSSGRLKTKLLIEDKQGVHSAYWLDGADGADGQDGTDGVSVTNATINNNGHLILSLSNGQTIDTGIARPAVPDCLPIEGGTMQGSINMNGRRITNVGQAQSNADAANKKYVDDTTSGAVESLSPFVVTGDIAENTVGNPSATYDAILEAYNSGREVLLKTSNTLRNLEYTYRIVRVSTNSNRIYFSGTEADVIDTIYVASGNTWVRSFKELGLDSLETGSESVTPIDTDYTIISEHSGGATVDGFRRRPFITVWNYIKDKVTKNVSLDVGVSYASGTITNPTKTFEQIVSCINNGGTVSCTMTNTNSGARNRFFLARLTSASAIFSQPAYADDFAGAYLTVTSADEWTYATASGGGDGEDTITLEIVANETDTVFTANMRSVDVYNAVQSGKKVTAVYKRGLTGGIYTRRYLGGQVFVREPTETEENYFLSAVFVDYYNVNGRLNYMCFYNNSAGTNMTIAKKMI